MKNKILKIIGSGLLVSLLVGSQVSFSEPGSSKDPLISKSYVDGKLEELRSYIDTKVKAATGDRSSNSSSDLEIVELRAGQSIIGGAGTEIILRSGRAVALASDLGGISDVSAGLDLGQGESLSQNHLVIIPRDDGRGVYSLGETFFMVRGDYRLE